jgi:alpha,alpha-trehalose phosphorylase
MEHRHLVAIRYQVRLLDGEAPIVISSQLRHEVEGGEGTTDHFDPRRSRELGDVLVPDGQARSGDRATLRYRVAESGLKLACGIDHVVECNALYTSETIVDDRRGKLVLQVDAEAGTTIGIDKYAVYFTSKVAATERLADRCDRVLDRALADGMDVIADRQRRWWGGFWERADIQVEGNEVVQQAVRWNMFQLAQATARVEGTGVPAKGLTGSGYEGHYFWDIEIYVLPFLVYTDPVVARNLLQFRCSLLDHARRRAAELNQRGALFPWRTINGEEASAYYEAGTAQYHINADITYALKKYLDITGDAEFLARDGAELLVETARLWADLGFFRDGRGPDTFHIFGVTGPDEYTTLVNDNAYTNLMARLNLRYAADVVSHLRATDPKAFDQLAHRTAVGDAEVATWRRAADAMHIPHDEHLGITPQDANFLEREQWDFDNTPRDRYPLLLHYHPLVIYRHQVIKQADIVLAMFLLPDEFGPELKRRNFEYYDPLTTGDSSLSAAIQSIVAAELEDHGKAIEYFRYALFMDLADVAANAADGVHIASAGGVWLSLVYGFGGMRDVDGKLSFAPRLPSGWERMSFPLTVPQGRLRVSATRFDVTYELEEGTADLTIHHRGEPITLAPGDRAVRSLAIAQSA